MHHVPLRPSVLVAPETRVVALVAPVLGARPTPGPVTPSLPRYPGPSHPISPVHTPHSTDPTPSSPGPYVPLTSLLGVGGRAVVSQGYLG